MQEARAALAQPDPQGRAAALARAGIGVVVVDRTAPGGEEAGAVEVAGRRLPVADDLVVVEVPGAVARQVPRAWVVATAAGWGGWLVLLVGPLLRAAQRMSHRRQQ